MPMKQWILIIILHKGISIEKSTYRGIFNKSFGTSSVQFCGTILQDLARISLMAQFWRSFCLNRAQNWVISAAVFPPVMGAAQEVPHKWWPCILPVKHSIHLTCCHDRIIIQLLEKPNAFLTKWVLHHRSVPVFWLHLGECVCSNLCIQNNLEFQGIPGIGAEILSTTVVTAIAINFRSSSVQ